MNKVGAPGADPVYERGISQTKKMVRAGIPGHIRHQFEAIALSQGDIPRHGCPESAIQYWLLSSMPGIKDPDLEVVATGKALVERNVVLDRMRHNEREALL